MAEFIKAVPADSLPPGGKTSVKLGGRGVFLANIGGRYYAMGDSCTHMGCRLSQGEIKGENVECPCHGSVFEIKTGKVVSGPAKKPGPSFRTRVEGGQVMVEV